MARESCKTWGQVFLLVGVLYLFLVSIGMMGGAFKLFGKDFATQLVETTSNPLVGLFVGILATTLAQSSSTTTSITVGIVAAGGMTIESSVPIIMGANIGTSVTNTLVSMGHITRREEFRRALAGATVHDFFNLIAVALLLPLELMFGYLKHLSLFVAKLFVGVGGMKLANPLKAIAGLRWLHEVRQAKKGERVGVRVFPAGGFCPAVVASGPNVHWRKVVPQHFPYEPEDLGVFHQFREPGPLGQQVPDTLRTILVEERGQVQETLVDLARLDWPRCCVIRGASGPDSLQ